MGKASARVHDGDGGAAIAGRPQNRRPTMRMTGKIGLALVLIGVGAVSLSGCGSSCHDNVEVTWTLVDANNAVYPCEDVGAQFVVITMGGMSTTFNCNAYDGVTTPVRAGTYATSFTLRDGNSKVR